MYTLRINYGLWILFGGVLVSAIALQRLRRAPTVKSQEKIKKPLLGLLNSDPFNYHEVASRIRRQEGRFSGLDCGLLFLMVTSIDARVDDVIATLALRRCAFR